VQVCAVMITVTQGNEPSSFGQWFTGICTIRFARKWTPWNKRNSLLGSWLIFSCLRNFRLCSETVQSSSPF
jgi:hypothetical protein